MDTLRYKNFISSSDVKEMYKALQRSSPQIVEEAGFINNFPDAKFRGKHTKIVNPDASFQQMIRYWQDVCMSKCSTKPGKPTPREWLDKHGDELKQSLGEPKKIYDEWCRQTGCCSTFPPTTVMALIRLLGVRSILDTKVEWGDRLLGAMAADIESYVGLETMECQQVGFRNMIKFTGADPTKFYVVPKLIDIDAKFDLVFARPEFHPSIWNNVKSGGYLCIINPREPQQIPNAEYLGIIMYTIGSKLGCLALYTKQVSLVENVNTKLFESIRFRNMDARAHVERAFEIVRDFIVKRRRLLAGGMSVDMALRMKGSRLYPDDTLPDYDFLTPDNATDSYDLARLLCEAKLPDVDAIGAMHVTTQRVRVLGVVVADITYVPATIFAQMHTIDSGAMRLLHPYYTMLDQFTALGMPYENPPHEVIIERWAKDIKRLGMLLPMFPIPKPEAIPTTFYDLTIPTGNLIITGWAALAYYSKSIEDRTKTSFADGKCRIPQPFVTIMTDEWESIPAENPKYFNSMMGFPRHIEADSIHIHDTLGLKIGILRDTNIVSLPALMWYFMHRWLRYGDQIDLYGANLTLEHINSGKWKLDITTYGKYIWNLAFVHFIREFNEVPDEKKNRPPPLFFMGEENPCTNPSPTFEPQKSIYFTIDGSPTTRWEPLFPVDTIIVGGQSPPPCSSNLRSSSSGEQSSPSHDYEESPFMMAAFEDSPFIDDSGESPFVESE